MSKGSPIRQIRMNDELWTKMQQAAAAEGAKRGKPMPVSEWVRGVLKKAVK